MEIKQVVRYQTDDGFIFESAAKAQEYLDKRAFRTHLESELGDLDLSAREVADWVLDNYTVSLRLTAPKGEPP